MINTIQRLQLSTIVKSKIIFIFMFIVDHSSCIYNKAIPNIISIASHSFKNFTISSICGDLSNIFNNSPITSIVLWFILCVDNDFFIRIYKIYSSSPISCYLKFYGISISFMKFGIYIYTSYSRDISIQKAGMKSVLILVSDIE